MACKVWLCAFVLMNIARAGAFRVDRTVPLACNGRLDTSNSALYNLAYEWTKHRPLDHWAYEDLGKNGIGYNCARVRYSTQVSVHQLFENVLPSRILKTSVDKQVCAGEDKMDETVLLSDIVLINTLTITVHVSIDRKTHTLTMVASSDLAVPWFLSMLQSSIVHELEQSLAEYHELLAQAACREHGETVQLKRSRPMRKGL